MHEINSQEKSCRVISRRVMTGPVRLTVNECERERAPAYDAMEEVDILDA